jgi:hypothetical protein
MHSDSSHNNQLTPWSRLMLENLIIALGFTYLTYFLWFPLEHRASKKHLHLVIFFARFYSPGSVLCPRFFKKWKAIGPTHPEEFYRVPNCVCDHRNPKRGPVFQMGTTGK